MVAVYCDFENKPYGVRCRQCHRALGGTVERYQAAPQFCAASPDGVGSQFEKIAKLTPRGKRGGCGGCGQRKEKMNKLGDIAMARPENIAAAVRDIAGDTGYPKLVVKAALKLAVRQARKQREKEENE